MTADFRKDLILRELSECLGYIKNIVILGGTAEVGAGTLLCELSEISTALRPVFEEMARYINVNDKESAARCFEAYVNTGLSPGIGSFLTGWDDMPPCELADTIDAYLSLIKEERLTSGKKRNEIISDLIYIPVIINCIVILINFIYVAYFLEEQESLSLLL